MALDIRKVGQWAVSELGAALAMDVLLARDALKALGAHEQQAGEQGTDNEGEQARQWS